jgi:small neutral amino acid transporter SnatA (MarC family)
VIDNVLAGTGAITTVMLIAAQSNSIEKTIYFSLVIFSALLITLFALLLARPLSAALGETGTNVISRLLGFILAALAVQYIIDGIKQSFFV